MFAVSDKRTVGGVVGQWRTAYVPLSEIPCFGHYRKFVPVGDDLLRIELP